MVHDRTEHCEKHALGKERLNVEVLLKTFVRGRDEQVLPLI
jgi:hypothetical protein